MDFYNRVGNFNQPFVVRDDYRDSIRRAVANTLYQLVDGRGIKIIIRLIKNQHVGRLFKGSIDRNFTSFAARSRIVP